MFVICMESSSHTNIYLFWVLFSTIRPDTQHTCLTIHRWSTRFSKGLNMLFFFFLRLMSDQDKSNRKKHGSFYLPTSPTAPKPFKNKFFKGPKFSAWNSFLMKHPVHVFLFYYTWKQFQIFCFKYDFWDNATFRLSKKKSPCLIWILNLPTQIEPDVLPPSAGQNLMQPGLE